MNNPAINKLSQNYPMKNMITDDIQESDIAIIAMSGRFPGANNIEKFWENLQSGIESITWLSEEELLKNGVPLEKLQNPNYVKASTSVENIDLFDAKFFGFSPKEAEILDPQQRLFLECAWETLEQAGYVPQSYPGSIGIYAGLGISGYLLENLYLNPIVSATADLYQITLTNDKDFLPTRVAYKLNLTGPAVNIQTACSTSLVAVHIASQSLLNGECDMALAGGVTLYLSQNQGYLYQEGMILSPDGHCRAFDAKAQGTKPGGGVGIILLKRALDAIADRDYIYAIIKGSAINNDGTNKIGFTAPSIEGQAAVIQEAQAVAGIEAETITYIETHGTGTELGDPIEIAALTKAFQKSTQNKQFCAIGSVKTNIGHSDTAAGVMGLIKTVLALKHQQIPPSLHFQTPNPKIDFTNSPFYVNTKLSEWKTNGSPRRAGVSSFGIGGTNAHIILEQVPLFPPNSTEEIPSHRPYQLLVLSAKTPSALETITTHLYQHLKQHPHLNLTDVAFTLNTGRQNFNHRRILVSSHLEETVNALNSQQFITKHTKSSNPPVIFMFSGQGSQYVNMGREIYETEAIFREQIDYCAELLQPQLGLDIREIIYPNPDLYQTELASQKLQQTAIAQPALFIIEYALAKLWESWGVRPLAAIGHSIGEYVAACLAGVFSLEDALSLVAIRGQMMDKIRGGAMLSVPLSELEIEPYLTKDLSIAAINSPSLCVISGLKEAIEQLENQLANQGIECQLLKTSGAFHSQMMESILKPFAEKVKTIPLKTPQLPYLSNVTGKWITETEATSPEYWAKHLRQTVQFSQAITELFQDPEQILLEIGPGQTLTTLIKRHPHKPPSQLTLTSLRHPQQTGSDSKFLLTTLGQLWLEGVNINWSKFYESETPYHIPLPTYPFERQRYWIDHQEQQPPINIKTEKLGDKKPEITDWFYLPSWKNSPLLAHQFTKTSLGNILLFMDDQGLGEKLVQKLTTDPHSIIHVQPGETFRKEAKNLYILNPAKSQDYEQLLAQLQADNLLPHQIIHLWNISQQDRTELTEQILEKAKNVGFYSLLYLAQSLGKHHDSPDCQLTIISNNMQEVGGEDWLCPEKSTLIGCVKVIPQEYSHLTCRSVDILLPKSTQKQQILLTQLQGELLANSEDIIIAYRGNNRLVQTYEPIKIEPIINPITPLKEGGIYLITGGLGGIGLVLAEYLANTVKAKLILTGRSTFPERSQWPQWLTNHEPQNEISQKIQKIQELEAKGSQIIIISADLTDEIQMQKELTQATQNLGKINGIIHAAGVPGGGVIQRKTWETVYPTLAPKIQGTLVLHNLFKDTELDWFILCSSLTSILGEIGQVDYCAANAFLDSFAHYRNHQGYAKTISINWDTWQQVGMAVKAAKNLTSDSQFPPHQLQKITHPLFNQCIIENPEKVLYISQLSVHKHWILDEHRLMGKATLPGTAYLEIIRAAFENLTQTAVMELEEVFLMNPLTVEDTEEKEVRTLLTKESDHWEFSIISRSPIDTAKWLEHARGKIAISPTQSPQFYNIEELIAQCNDREIDLTETPKDSTTELLKFGPRWEIFKQIKIGKDSGLALLELPVNYRDDLKSYQLHPSILDGAINFLTSQQVGFYLPFSFQNLRVKERLTNKVYSYIKPVKNAPSTPETLKFDIIILDEQGKVLTEIQEYTLRKLTLETQNKNPQLTETQPPTPPTPPISPRETNPVQQLLKHGLSSQEGVEVFQRILSNTIPQILVSTQDLPTLIQTQGNKGLTELENIIESLPPSTNPRPPLATAYVSPRNEIEQTIAQIWQQYLGIESIGIYDDFFELGGDSLLGIQLTSKLSQTLQQKISPNSLLNAPTIAGLAEFLGITKTLSQPSKERSSLLVQLHKGNQQKQPLFLIHPVGGSVYSYRYLAHHLGENLPVYAIQAKGLDGDGEPLNNIQEMAKHYLSLLKTIQPIGPYQLGGWSLGGLVALEIAQILHQQSEEVSLLVMIDTFTPRGVNSSSDTNEVTLIADFASYTGNVSGQDFFVSVDDLKPLSPEQRLKYIWTQARQLGVLPPELELEQFRYRWEAFKNNYIAMDSHKAHSYSGQITFFCASESMEAHQDPSLGWSPLAQGGILTEIIPGNHYSIIESDQLAEKLRTCF